MEFKTHLLEIHCIIAPPYKCFVQKRPNQILQKDKKAIKKRNKWLPGNSTSFYGEKPRIYHQCNFQSEKDHFNSFLNHYNKNHLKSPSLMALNASEFEQLYELITARTICSQPVGRFVEIKEIKLENEIKTENEEFNNEVKNETDSKYLHLKTEIKTEIKIEPENSSEAEIVAKNWIEHKKMLEKETETPENVEQNQSNN